MRNKGSFHYWGKAFFLLRIVFFGMMLLVLLTIWKSWEKSWPVLALFVVLPWLLPVLVDRVGHLFGTFIMEGYRPRNPRERFSGELIKARCMKAERNYTDALAGVNFVLSKMPDHPDALFLKAQILCEGFERYVDAKRCLEQVAAVDNPPPDETTSNWAAHLLEEVTRKIEKAGKGTHRKN